jgi:hypothetical protein
VSLTTIGEQEPQSSFGCTGSLSSAITFLASAGIGLRNIVTEAALVSACPDVFFGVPLAVRMWGSIIEVSYQNEKKRRQKMD